MLQTIKDIFKQKKYQTVTRYIFCVIEDGWYTKKGETKYIYFDSKEEALAYLQKNSFERGFRRYHSWEEFGLPKPEYKIEDSVYVYFHDDKKLYLSFEEGVSYERVLLG